LDGGRVDRALISYLTAHRGGAKYLVAANGSMTAAPIILATHQPVITMGGFGGADPTPSVSQLTRLIARGELRYVLLGGFGGGAPRGAARGFAGVGRQRAPGGAASGAASRESWVSSHCKTVSSTLQGLYDCSQAR
jgi:hypothetical protein